MKTADARRWTLVLGLLASGMAMAVPHYVPSRDWGNFIWVGQQLDAGVQYTFETHGLTGSAPDTVLHVLRDRGGWSQVTANDDCAAGGGLRSCVTFTAPDTGYYYLWVRAYADGKGGTTNLSRNGTLLLSAQPFGGVAMPMTWGLNDTFRVAGTTPAPNDYMLFLLRSTTDYIAHDDDTGPRYYPAMAAGSNQNLGSERVVVGRYPGSTGPALFVHDEPLFWTPYGTNDLDQDGLSNALEKLIGLSADKADSDGDTVPDKWELLGNDGFSFSEWGVPGLRDLYVEIDWMEHPTNPYLTRKPYPELVADATNIFTQDSDSSIRLHAFIDGPLPWSEVVCFDNCAGGASFYDLKRDYFSSFNPERRPYFHYAVWGYRHTSNTTCSSGLAELLGNDLIISMACWSSPSQAEQRGTFIHELGHNLALSHNGNDVSNQYSSVHNSVMNYRYQFSGVPSTGRHTYSFGTNSCAACESSPKAACSTCRSGVLGCGWFGCGSCDCDVNEWATLAFDFSSDSDASDGAPAGRSPRAESFEPDDKGGPRKARARMPYVEAPSARLQAEVVARKARLGARGLVEGRDFLVSSDETRLYTSCP
ncbi:pre-peptidase C-terminal domain-containing protein [Myxococcaceae bacterium GXIMD 01537]